MLFSWLRPSANAIRSAIFSNLPISSKGMCIASILEAMRIILSKDFYPFSWRSVIFYIRFDCLVILHYQVCQSLYFIWFEGKWWFWSNMTNYVYIWILNCLLQCLKPHLLVMISCVEACYQNILVCVLFWTIYRAINQDFCFKVCYYFNDMFAANNMLYFVKISGIQSDVFLTCSAKAIKLQAHIFCIFDYIWNRKIKTRVIIIVTMDR